MKTTELNKYVRTLQCPCCHTYKLEVNYVSKGYELRCKNKICDRVWATFCLNILLLEKLLSKFNQRVAPKRAVYGVFTNDLTLLPDNPSFHGMWIDRIGQFALCGSPLSKSTSHLAVADKVAISAGVRELGTNYKYVMGELGMVRVVKLDGCLYYSSDKRIHKCQLDMIKSIAIAYGFTSTRDDNF